MFYAVCTLNITILEMEFLHILLSKKVFLTAVKLKYVVIQFVILLNNLYVKHNYIPNNVIFFIYIIS